MWYNRERGVYRLKESRERRTQVGMQAGCTAQEIADFEGIEQCVEKVCPCLEL